MLRTLLAAAGLVILIGDVSRAQPPGPSANGNTAGGGMNMNMLPDTRRHLTPEEAQREREIETRYNETVRDKIPDKKVSNDPWGSLRSAPAGSSASKQSR